MAVSLEYVQGKNCNNLNVMPRGNLLYNTNKMKFVLYVFKATFDFH